ncbi:hypothetical protein GCM10023210_07190 [Chryseobacterium ginsengisoli]|uniref:Uncharacterized protein n=1 Tax=Chryseobacterium ginsengisoli TaxID=363853 RepID=A0ABP9LZI3_9FLAO
MKTILATLFFIFSLIKIQATEQQTDLLYINGEKYHILNKFLHQDILGQYIEDNKLNSEINTGLWRGYIGEFIVENNIFKMKDAIIPIDYQKDTNLRLSKNHLTILENLNKKSINTVLFLSKIDNSIHRLDQNFSTIKVLEIKDNEVVKNFDLNSDLEYNQFKCDQFQKYKQTKAYKRNYYYSLKTIQNSREKYDYEDEILPIQEEVENFIADLLFEEEDFTHIL